MDIFVSPMATVIAKTVAFISGSVLAVLVLLTVWDEDVLNVEHVSHLMGFCLFSGLYELKVMRHFNKEITKILFWG